MAKLFYWLFFLAIPGILYCVGIAMALRCSIRWDKLSEKNGFPAGHSASIEFPRNFIVNARSWPFAVRIGTISFPLYSLWRVIGQEAYGNRFATFSFLFWYTILVLLLGVLVTSYIARKHADISFSKTYGTAQSDIDAIEAQWNSTVMYLCFWLFVFTTLSSFS